MPNSVRDPRGTGADAYEVLVEEISGDLFFFHLVLTPAEVYSVCEVDVVGRNFVYIHIFGSESQTFAQGRNLCANLLPDPTLPVPPETFCYLSSVASLSSCILARV